MAATQKMIICLYPFCNARDSAAFLTRAAAIVAKERVLMEGGLRRFSRACALAQACRCEVQT